MIESTDPIVEFALRHQRLFVLTGAGCSTASGIPDYRDQAGNWKRPAPMNYTLFMESAAARARYWARSMVGWRSFQGAQPNAAHTDLAWLASQGRVTMLVTQNVDRLHQAAGSENVIDLHGRLDQVRCMGCERRFDRALWQTLLEQANPTWLDRRAEIAPDGDADLNETDFSSFVVPTCSVCDGIIKPDVVFFGETVPVHRVEQALAAMAESDGMLVVGSSLMVYSGFRFARAAAREGLPLAAINLGHTRADDLLDVKADVSAQTGLAAIRAALEAQRVHLTT